MPENKKLVQFGLSDVHYSIHDADTDSYGAWKPISGAVSLNLSPEGSTDKHYADNVTYYTSTKNSGYSGSLTIFKPNDDFRQEVLGEILDATTGLLYEHTKALPKEVALRFKIDGNERDEITVLYNVTFSRPSGDNGTNEDSTTVKNYSLDFNAVGRDVTINGDTVNVIKATIENTAENKTKYAALVSKVVLPGTAASA